MARGTITKRVSKDGKVSWQAAITLGDGQRRYFYAKTQEDAQRRLAEATHDRDKGLPGIRDGRQTVATFLTGWLERVKPSIRATTHRRYCELLTLHAIPALGKLSLVKLTPDRVEKLYAEKLAEGLASVCTPWKDIRYSS